jgi:hypothetical protein
MVGYESPGETVGIGFLQQSGKALDKGFSIGVVAKDIPPFNASNNDMLQEAGYIESGLTWHE